MEIAANRLDRGFIAHQEAYEAAALRVLRSGYYVLGEEVAKFEQEFARYIGAPHCVGLANGLDALEIAFNLKGVGEGDEIIVQSNAYIACVMGITKNGGTPVFVEPDEFYNIDPDKIEAAITDKTRGILVVHLYGQASDMVRIEAIARKHSLFIIEDCAQSHGAKQGERTTGSIGEIGCFSFYPSKNLGAFGDAGAITTNASELDKKFRIFRNYGSEKRYYNQMIGSNSRLDPIQAALLAVRLKHMEEINEERLKISRRYLEEITNKRINLPTLRPGCESVWHQFVIRVEENRENFMGYLKDRGVETLIHYPIPPHLSEAYRHLGYTVGDFPIAERYANTMISLPLYNGMTQEEQTYVIQVINDYEGMNESAL